MSEQMIPVSVIAGTDIVIRVKRQVGRIFINFYQFLRSRLSHFSSLLPGLTSAVIQ